MLGESLMGAIGWESGFGSRQWTLKDAERVKGASPSHAFRDGNNTFPAKTRSFKLSINSSKIRHSTESNDTRKAQDLEEGVRVQCRAVDELVLVCASSY